MPASVGIALGSNLGDSLGKITTARDMLRDLALPEIGYLQAPVYRSEPLDCPEGSPDFLNTVIEITYAGSPHELLECTRGIESKLGRERDYGKNAPRTIDIDILYFGDMLLDDDQLTIPHPGITRRRFVLQPLADIRPELILPGNKATMAEILHHLDSGEPPLNLMQPDW